MDSYNLWRQESDRHYKMHEEVNCTHNGNTINNVGYIDFTDSNSRTVKPMGNSDFLLIYILEGFGNYTVNNVKFEAFQGDIVVIPPALPHKYNYENFSGTKVYFIHFSGKDFSHLCGLADLKPHYSLGLQDKLCERFDDILFTLKNKKPFYKEIAVNLSLALVAEIMSLISLSGNAVPSRLSNAVTHITNHPEENLSLEEYAKMCIMSVSHFSKEFKKFTGMSPVNYRNSIRINKAKKIILKGGTLLSDLSSLLGFSSYSQFHEKFKSLTGISPKEFSKKNSRII